MPGDANLGRAVLEITTRDIDLSKNLKKSEADVKAWIARQEASFQKFGQTMGKSLDSSTSQVSSSLSKLESSATKGAGGLKTLETAVISNAGSLKNTASAAAQAEAKFASMSTSVAGGAKGMGMLNTAVSGLVPGLNLGALGFAGLGIAALKSAGDFESSMARLQIMTGITDKSSDAFKQLEAAAISVGEKTKFSGQEAADGMAELAAAGLNVKDTITAINPVAQAAAINQTSIAEASKTATVAMNAFGLKASDVSKIIDVQTTAANLGVMKFQDFQQAMASVGSVAKLSNQDLTGVTSALIALTNNGQSAADAGTSIKSALMSLTNPSAEAAGAMKELGLNVFDAKGKMLPFADIVRQIEQNTKGMTDAQRNQLLATLAGSDGIRAFAGALGASITIQKDGREVTLKGADALIEFQKQLDNSAGSSDKAAKIIQSTFGAQLEELKGQIEELVRKFGTELLPIAKETVGVLGTKVESPTQLFKDWKGLIPILVGTGDALKTTKSGFEEVNGAIKNARGQIVAILADGQTAEQWAKEHGVTMGFVSTAYNVTAQSAEFYRKKLQAVNESIDQSGKAEDGLKSKLVSSTSAIDDMTAARQRFILDLDKAGVSYDKLGDKIYNFTPAVQKVIDKMGSYSNVLSGVEGELYRVGLAQDEASQKLGASNKIISDVNAAFDVMTLQTGNVTVKFGEQDLTLSGLKDKWFDFTEIQRAGGKGSLEAGIAAGELKNKMITLYGEGVRPYLDALFQQIDVQNNAKLKMGETATEASKLTNAQELAASAASMLTDRAEVAAKKLMGQAGAASETSSKMNDTASAIDNANKRLGEWNDLPSNPKKPESNFDALSSIIATAVGALQKWNTTPYNSKSATVTTTYNTVGSPPPTAPQPKYYAEGTGYHPGGPAIIGEDGPELLKMPGRLANLILRPTLFLDLPKASEVVPMPMPMPMPDFSNWQPSVGAATQALGSSATSTPLLNSGLSMPAPVVSNGNSEVSTNVTLVLPNVTNQMNQAQVKAIAEAVVKEQATKLKGY